MATEFFAPAALLPSGWQTDVLISTDEGGAVRSAAPVNELGTLPSSVIRLPGPVIPGFPNIHSHSFQRGMAGLAEWRATEQDSFWSWRETMYRFVLALDPEDVRAITEYLYAELMVHGYTSVAEFHYVHRDRDGTFYSDAAELARAIVESAKSTGMGLTLLPTLYTYGGCGRKPLGDAQRRFNTTPDDIQRIWNQIRQETEGSDTRVGVAAHSIRASDPAELASLLGELTSVDPTLPIHMHIAEQRREVDECVAWSGQTPVAWAFEHLPINDHWCLIHATHVMASELEAIAAAQATAGICPTTEANLGDGAFPAKRFLELGGRLAIGSDSHVSVSPFEELRELEYLQRLIFQRRNVLSTDGVSTGRFLADQAWQAGARASGRPIGKLAAGCRCDFLVLSADHPRLIGRQNDRLLDTLIFGGSPDMIDSVYVGGKRFVEQGRHVQHDRLAQQYREAMKRIRPRLESA